MTRNSFIPIPERKNPLFSILLKKRFDSFSVLKFYDSNYSLRLERKAQVPYFAGTYSSLGGTMSSIKCGTLNEYRCGKGINPTHHLNKTNCSLISCTDGGALQKFRFNIRKPYCINFGGFSE
jgi:hypothetical protein